MFISLILPPSRHSHPTQGQSRGPTGHSFDWSVNRDAHQSGMLISSFPSISHHAPPASPLLSKMISWHSPAAASIGWPIVTPLDQVCLFPFFPLSRPSFAIVAPTSHGFDCSDNRDVNQTGLWISFFLLLSFPLPNHNPPAFPL